jgi:hypothetical protein
MGLVHARQTEIHSTEPLVSEPSAFEIEMAIEKLKRQITKYWSNPSKNDSSRDKTICSKIRTLTNSVWNKEELPADWKESIIVPFYKKGDKTVCSNYRGVSLLSTTYKILSNILLSRLTPYADIIGDYQCGFRRHRSTSDHVFCTRQMPEKKWECNEVVH